jgi:hypothetical protein
MTPDELRAIMASLRERVCLDPKEAKSPVVITFHAPTEEEMIGEGLNAEDVKRILRVSWWEEMVTDIIETPDYCDSGDSPQQVLEYARDVVSDYIRKRVSLSGD